MYISSMYPSNDETFFYMLDMSFVLLKEINYAFQKKGDKFYTHTHTQRERERERERLI